jgi:hypothetical protein
VFLVHGEISIKELTGRRGDRDEALHARAYSLKRAVAANEPCTLSIVVLHTPGLTSPSTSVGGKALNPIGAAEDLGGCVLIAGPPCLGIC